jgi:hypothetical protein
MQNVLVEEDDAGVGFFSKGIASDSMQTTPRAMPSEKFEGKAHS